MLIRSLLSLCLIFSAANSYALSLQETIKIAFDNNPITEANNLRLEAAKWDARGVKLDRLPNGYMSYSHALNYYKTTFDGNSFDNNSENKGWNIGISARLYDGGAGKNRVCVAQKNYEALEATNNSTNPLIPDTLGSLASDIFEVYVEIATVNSAVNFLNEQQKYLEILLKHAKTDDQRSEIRATLKDIRSKIENHIFEGDTSIFKYEEELVKVPISPTMDTLEQVANSITVPLTVEEAIQIGTRKKPEILIAQARAEAARCSLKAKKAQAFSPKVDLSVNRGSYHNDGMGPSSSSIGNSVNVTVTVPLNPGQYAYVKSESSRAEATERDLEKELTEMKSELKGTLYRELKHYEKETENYRQSLIDNNIEIQEVLKKVQNNESVDYKHAMSLLSRHYYHYYWSFSQSLNSYVETKFTIQKTIGTLFDYIDPNIKDRE